MYEQMQLEAKNQIEEAYLMIREREDLHDKQEKKSSVDLFYLSNDILH